MKLLFLAAFLLIMSVPCFAQDSAQFRACTDEEMSQTGMDRCAGDEAARADSELNAVYQRLLKKAASVPGATEKIKQLERAWITYRDAYLEAMYPREDKQAAYGTIYPMEASLIAADLTRKQTKELEDLIKQYDEEEQ